MPAARLATAVRWIPLLWCVVVVSEFVVRPAAEEGEWVELLHAGPGPVALDGWTLNDGTGRLRELPAGVLLEPGAVLVLAARPESLRIAFGLESGVRIERPSGWGVLNDRDGSGGAPADVIVLRDAGGSLVDSVAYFEAWLPPEAGHSLERVDPNAPSTEPGTWAWSSDPRGATPGFAATAPAPPPAGDWAGPAAIQPARSPAVFRYRVPGPGTAAVWLVDREGNEVAVLREPAPVSPRGTWVWGAAQPGVPRAGTYFVCLRWHGERGAAWRRCHRVWVTP